MSKEPEPETPSKVESPSQHFERPKDVLRDPSLDTGEKKAVLETWATDAEALQRAEDEGMGGGEPSKMIDVVSAKKDLDRKD